MNRLYEVLNTTKQNMHQRLRRQMAVNDEQQQLLTVMRQLRQEHPAMGAKIMYHKLQPQIIGRDKFICFYRQSHFTLKRQRNYRKTTDSRGVIRFDNLLKEQELNGINQAWVSDITYYELKGRFCYLTFIMDLYSRKIKGYQASQCMRTTDTTIPALQMAMKYLKQGDMPVFHSDGGGQYYSREFLALTHGRFKNSMCESVYENAHAERVNGTIKSYLEGYMPEDIKQLRHMLSKAVEKYNSERPHQALKNLTPDACERLSLGLLTNKIVVNKEKRSKKENP
jgi:transposase InsO family protein